MSDLKRGIWAELGCAEASGYLCGVAKISSRGEPDPSVDECAIYLVVLCEIIDGIGISQQRALTWQGYLTGAAATRPNENSKVWALVAWRKFWEQEGIATLPTGLKGVQCRRTARGTFWEFFHQSMRGVVRETERMASALHRIVTTEAMRATYAQAYGLCNSRPNMSVAMAEMLSTPMPVILVTEVSDGDLIVTWVHQKSLAEVDPIRWTADRGD